MGDAGAIHTKVTLDTPAETMAAVVSLRQAGKMAEAAEFFAENGILVMEPDNRAIGRAAIKDGLAAMSKTFPVFVIESRAVIQRGNIALHHSRWCAQGVGIKGEPIDVGGTTADVLELQPDGRWLVLIDNPWGGTILD